MVKKWLIKQLFEFRYFGAINKVNAVPTVKVGLLIDRLIELIELMPALNIRNKDVPGKYEVTYYDFNNLIGLLEEVNVGMRNKMYIDRGNMSTNRRVVSAYRYLMDEDTSKAIRYCDAVRALKRTLGKLQVAYVIVEQDDGLREYYGMILSSILSDACVFLNIFGEIKWQSKDKVQILIKNR